MRAGIATGLLSVMDEFPHFSPRKLLQPPKIAPISLRIPARTAEKIHPEIPASAPLNPPEGPSKAALVTPRGTAEMIS
jgi:hypothetical protein